MSDLNQLNNYNFNNKIDLSINNTYSIFISSYIANFTPLIYPIIILFDGSNKTSLYYSLYIQNRILLINKQYNIITIDIKINFETKLFEPYISDKFTFFYILDCIYDIEKCLTYIQSNLEDKIQIAKIYSILNYFNMSEIKLKLFYYLLSKTVVINIIDYFLFKSLNNQYLTPLVYKDLDQNNLISTFVVSSDISLNNFRETKNYFIIQSVSDYYKIYFLKHNLNNSFLYVMKWNYFSYELIHFINSLDEFDNLINYQIVSVSNIVCQNYLEDLVIQPFLINYPIRYISNYNNILMIDNYIMKSFSYQNKLKLIDNNIMKTSNFSDSIYKINGSVFEPLLTLDNMDPSIFKYTLRLSTSNSSFNIVLYNNQSDKTNSDKTNSDKTNYDKTNYDKTNYDKTDFYETDITDNSDIYNVKIYLQLKYDKLKTLKKEYIQMEDFYIQMLIISKKQYNLKRYIIINNQLMEDNDIDINIWYNPFIKKGNFLSQIFFDDIIVYNNIMG
jgi:hypothetical protein